MQLLVELMHSGINWWIKQSNDRLCEFGEHVYLVANLL